MNRVLQRGMVEGGCRMASRARRRVSRLRGKGAGFVELLTFFGVQLLGTDYKEVVFFCWDTDNLIDCLVNDVVCFIYIFY